MSCFIRLRRRTAQVSHPPISAHVSPSVAHLSHVLFWLGRRFTLCCRRVVVVSTRHRSSPTRLIVPRGTQVSAATVHSGGTERESTATATASATVTGYRLPATLEPAIGTEGTQGMLQP
jgi:hypothetical protein